MFADIDKCMSHGELLDLAELYNCYVLRYRDSYIAPVKHRLSLSAYFDLHVLEAVYEVAEKVYMKSPTLENSGTLRSKMEALDRAGLEKLLNDYDSYIKLQDMNLDGDPSVPVCLEEYYDSEYDIDTQNLMVERLSAQYKVIETALIAEGAQAMREKNFAKLEFVECFVSGYRDSCLEWEELFAAATLVREDSLIPALLDWADGRDIPLTLESDLFNDLFDQFGEHAISVIEKRGSEI